MRAVHGGDSINTFGFLMFICRLNSCWVGLSVKFHPVRMSTFRGQVQARWKGVGTEQGAAAIPGISPGVPSFSQTPVDVGRRGFTRALTSQAAGNRKHSSATVQFEHWA